MIAAWLIGTALAAAGPAGSSFSFVEAESSTLPFVNRSGADEQWAILEQNGQGVCALDYDGDGRLDLYFVDGSTRERWQAASDGTSALFHNRGGRRFEDVSARAGVPGPRWGTGCAAADFDTDGWTDLLVLGWRESRLYRNRGDGRFEDVTASAGLSIPGWASSAVFADLDGDGTTDVAVSRYVDFDFERFPTTDDRGKPCEYRGVISGCPPFLHAPQSTLGFRQRSPGRFEPIGAESGLGAATTRGFGIVALPLSAGSRLPDVYVACDQMENRLFVNRTAATPAFEERAAAMGAATNADGRPESGMGLAVGDVWEDGHPDLFLTNFAGEKNTLYRNLGASFTDATAGTGLEAHTAELGWGNALADFDADSHLDAILANGHIYPQVEKLGDPADRYAQPIRLFAGDGAGRFQEIVLPAFGDRRSRRGLVTADLDDDGRIDVVTQTHRGRPQIFWNESAPKNRWIRFRLVPTPGRAVQGARLTIELADGSRRTAWHAPNQGYQSSHDPRVHFGLGGASRIESLEIVWPGGVVERLDPLDADRTWILHRGERPRAEKNAIP